MIRVEVERDGEWVPLEGVTSVELQAEDPDLAPYVKLRAALRAASQLITAASQAVQSTGLVDERGHPRCRDRPAWQSPYGPPQRRRR